MNREDIYDHLAQVYLGKTKKEEKKKKQQFNAWLLINVVTTVVIFASVFYGMTAFFTHKKPVLQNRVVYSLHNGFVQMEYNFNKGIDPKKELSLSMPNVDASKYSALKFSIRSKEEGTPGMIKVVIANNLNEEAYYYVQGINMNWMETEIPLSEFKQITDWSNLNDIAFVVESWNVDDKTGVVLIDDICFSGLSRLY